MKIKHWLPLAALFGLVVGCASGCAQKSHGFQDSPVSQRYTDNKPAQIINFPNRFFNVAEKCDHHGNMLYSNTRDGAQVAVVPDRQCPTDWPIP